jgi:hypothetical protein
MSDTSKSTRTSPRNRKATLKRAKGHFAPVLEMFAGELSFVLKRDALDLIPGARVTSTLPLSGFIELFGDLVEAENFRLESYRQRNQEMGFGIDDTLFESWQEAGCLNE